MSERDFPDNFAEHRNEFNRLSEADRQKLDDRDAEKVKRLDVEKNTAIEKAREENERRRAARIEKEKQHLLGKASPGRRGPAPSLGGQRLDRSAGTASHKLSPEQLRSVDETAEKNVREKERTQLARIEKQYRDAQKAVIDKALGKDRDPRGHER